MDTVKTTESKATLVTALYHHSYDEIIGGRGWCFDFYSPPFLNILKLDLPIIIYTHKKVFGKLDKFMQKHRSGDYKIITQDLNDFQYGSRILEIKRNSGWFFEDRLKGDIPYTYNDRNHTLCLSKLYWLNEAVNTNIYNSNSFFWIDGGLFHHGIFPEKFGGREKFSKQENRPELYYPENKSSIFTPNMGKFLSNYKEKFLTIIKEEMPIRPRIKELIAPLGHKHIDYIVGGLFGGDPESINSVHKDFDEGLQVCLDNDLVTLEEELLSCVALKHPHLYNKFYFSQWWHDIKGDPAYYDIDENEKCFYKLFKNKFQA
tara:strand:- start:1435 stop:2385 length:951 start_codon:yes stop_codon:yes gene_type:complete